MKDCRTLYLHIPFCFSKCKYCDFFSVPFGQKAVSQDYVDSLCRELKYRLIENRTVLLETIYIGGGTPSLLSENQLKQILNTVKKCTSISESAEITIEVNPDDIDYERLEIYRRCGINRLSCGIQSMNDYCLTYAGRRADSEANRRALEILSEWTGKLSLDIICGLPGETSESFISGMNEIIAADPDHISMYSLSIEEGSVFGSMYDEGTLEYDFDSADSLWIKARNILEDFGYKQYEVSNFAKTGFECRNNLTYWNHKSYIGAGAGGTGTLYNEDGTAFRYTNIKDIEVYTKFWRYDKPDFKEIPQEKETVGFEDSVFEFFMMGLRKLEGVKEKDFLEEFNCAVPEKILGVLEKWQIKGNCIITGEAGNRTFTLGKKGIIYLNQFLQEIL